MPLDDGTQVVLRAARDEAKQAETSGELEELRDHGGRSKDALESIDRSEMEATVRHKIEEAIRHATNTQHASTPAGGRHDTAEVSRIINEILEAAD